MAETEIVETAAEPVVENGASSAPSSSSAPVVADAPPAERGLPADAAEQHNAPLASPDDAGEVGDAPAAHADSSADDPELSVIAAFDDLNQRYTKAQNDLTAARAEISRLQTAIALSLPQSGSSAAPGELIVPSSSTMTYAQATGRNVLIAAVREWSNRASLEQMGSVREFLASVGVVV
jgi:hypothetical protein